MPKIAAVLALFLEGISTGNPLLDAAMHYGSLAVLCAVLWLLLTRLEARNAAMALGYKQEIEQSIVTRTKILDTLTGIREDMDVERERREQQHEMLMKRLADILEQARGRHRES